MKKNKIFLIFLKLKNIAPFLIIILLPLFFFGKATLGKDLIVAGDFSGSDLLDLNYPLKVALSESIKNGKVPLWTPYLSNGFPLLAEGQMGAFYPPNLLLAFLPPHLALNHSIILTFILAGIFTFLYTRSIFNSSFPALVTAIIFMFSAFFIARIKHLNLIAVASWVPFIFWSTRKFFQKKNLNYAILTGIGLAFQFLAGHPQMAFYSLFIFIIYFGFEIFLSSKRGELRKTLPKALVAIFLIGFFATGLSLIQVLPTLELAGETERTEYTLQTATAYPFHPKNLITFISPYFFGNPALGSYKENIKIMGIFWENASYIGLLPIFLLPWGFLYALKKKKENLYPLFFSFLALFSLTLMLGKFTPLFGFLWENIPGFSIFRFPTRFNLFLILSLAILAGEGGKLLIQKLKESYQTTKEESPKITIKKSVLKFNWPLDPFKTKILILAFITIDLWVFGKNYIGMIDASWFLKKPQSVSFLENDKELFRILSVTQYSESPYQFLGWKRDLSPLVSIREAIPPDANLIFHIPTFSDRSWFEGGYNFKRRNKLERWLLNEATDPIIIGKILGLFNVKYILTFSPVGGFEMEKKLEIDLGKQFLEKLRIFENKQFMPRIYYTPEAKVITSESGLFTELSSYSFYPAKTVLLEKPPKNPLPTLKTTLDEFQKENEIKIEKYEGGEIIIKTNLKNEGFLVISESFYPGWKATVDGVPQEILPANYLVKALEMTPGSHTVYLFYDPLSFKIGKIVSLFTLILFFLLIGILNWKKLTLKLSKKELRQKPVLQS